MKNVLILLTLMMAGGTIAAQEAPQSSSSQTSDSESGNQEVQTLFSKDVKNGFYIAPVCRMGRIYKDPAVFVGGQLAWILDHSLALGFFGQGLASQVTTYNDAGDLQGMEMGYGGFLVEPIVMSNKVAHLTAPIGVGAGGVAFFDNTRFDYNYRFNSAQAFFVIEPGVNIELNMTRHLRFIAGGSYRIISDMDRSNALGGELSGTSVFAGFKLGVF
ncbi:MAG: hypothetical protein H6585_06120 [Flavobacteriales bacterium]|nr:hypothetical protein [Flavobacteriales bacterium]MCB9447904.1 hypothetical protein [Flavobacteriales bacterium]